MRFILVLAILIFGAACNTTKYYGGTDYYYPALMGDFWSTTMEDALIKGENAYFVKNILFRTYHSPAPPQEVVEENIQRFLQRIGADSWDELDGLIVTFTSFKIKCGENKEAVGCHVPDGHGNQIVMQLKGGEGWWIDTLNHELMHEELREAYLRGERLRRGKGRRVKIDDNHYVRVLKETQAYIMLDDYMLAGTQWDGVFGSGKIFTGEGS